MIKIVKKKGGTIMVTGIIAVLIILVVVFCFSQKEYDSKNTQIEKLEKIGLYGYPQDQSRF